MCLEHLKKKKLNEWSQGLLLGFPGKAFTLDEIVYLPTLMTGYNGHVNYFQKYFK